MPLGREARRSIRRAHAQHDFGRGADAALDILELAEFAWHDCYGDLALPDEIVDDIFVVGDRDLGRFARAAHLAVVDRRDLRIAADASRST